MLRFTQNLKNANELGDGGGGDSSEGGGEKQNIEATKNIKT